MENNLPAFPLVVPEGDWHRPGLSKREYFAGVAMQGLLSHPNIYSDTTPLEIVAHDAVKQADALIAELSKHQP